MTSEEAKPTVRGERHVAISFTDIVGFSDLTESLGDAGATHLVGGTPSDERSCHR